MSVKPAVEIQSASPHETNFGRVLQGDLSSGDIRRWQVPADILRLYIGGRGLGARLLLDILPAHTDPLSPANVLMFATGPLTGSPFPGSGKFVVITRSPATGAFLDSYSSGLLAAQMRFAGFDVLILTGKAPCPSYLLVEDEREGFTRKDDTLPARILMDILYTIS